METRANVKSYESYIEAGVELVEVNLMVTLTKKQFKEFLDLSKLKQVEVEFKKIKDFKATWIPNKKR